MYELAAPLLEAHLFGFSGSLYGEFLVVDFVRYLRPERKLPDLVTLKEQIETDAAEARSALASVREVPALDP
jgi:riboflavin kinase/FMN adenylyltransferase